MTMLHSSQHNRASSLLLFLLGAAISAWGRPADGQVFRQWNAPGGGEYGEGSNWIPSTSPGPLDSAIFDWSTPDDISIEFTQNYEAAAIQLIDGDAVFTNGGGGADSDTTFTIGGATINRNGHLKLNRTTADHDLNLVVDGSLDLFGQVSVGDDAVLSVSAILTVDADPSNPDGGRLTVRDTATLLTDTAALGGSEGKVGKALVTGDLASWDISGKLSVGYEGEAELDIEDGAGVNSDLTCLAQFGESSGIVRVNGVGADGNPSTWTTGKLDMGVAGVGQLNISGGAVVTSERVDLASRGSAAVHVSGVDALGNPSKWTTANMGVSLFGGTTQLTVDRGANVNNENVLLNGNSDARIAGTDATGNPSRWNMVSLGMLDGDLDIEDGAVVSSGEVKLGLTANVNIRGSDASGNPATWNVSGLLQIGGNGRADLSVNGGHISTGTTEITAATGTTPNSVFILNNGTWTNSGDVSVGGSQLAADAGSDGLLLIDGAASRTEIGGRLKVWGPGTVRVRDGDFTVDTIDHTDGGTLEFLGGTLQIDRFDGDLINQGSILSPGPDSGLTTVVGDLTQDLNATLALDIGGPGSMHDLVNVIGTATLDGLFELSLLNGFAPDAADEFTVLAANSLIGGFDNVTTGQRLDTIDGRGSFVVNYGVGSPLDEDRIILTDFLIHALLEGDFNGNNILDDGDIDSLTAAVGGTDLTFDLTADGIVDGADRQHWIVDLKNTYLGDSNLDLEFNSTDLVHVLNRAQYEDGIAGNSGWADGDWNGDGDFDSSDLGAALADGGYELGPRPPAASAAVFAAVPEPSGVAMLCIGLLAIQLRLGTGVRR